MKFFLGLIVFAISSVSFGEQVLSLDEVLRGDSRPKIKVCENLSTQFETHTVKVYSYNGTTCVLRSFQAKTSATSSEIEGQCFVGQITHPEFLCRDVVPESGMTVE